ncbi:ElaA protein [Labedaea rhizosphaerae]|uniref:ElaA protein n=2 Tax=Labedaea rhizosphaerae TaxID=598644 RepID=A0A4R6SBA7_LABRH|nr:ElaA protein [Labedaea rhizosphaerae]
MCYPVAMSPVTLRRYLGNELDAAALYKVLALRAAVFVVEQDCPYQDIDGRDLAPETLHILAEEDGALIGYLRVLSEPDGTKRIGRVCSSLSARGTGMGAMLMTDAVAAIGDTESVLDAQTYAQGFYAKFGYIDDGPEFLEDGIPHIPMRRKP